jgi:hypothetical protein
MPLRAGCRRYGQAETRTRVSTNVATSMKRTNAQRGNGSQCGGVRHDGHRVAAQTRQRGTLVTTKREAAQVEMRMRLHTAFPAPYQCACGNKPVVAGRLATDSLRPNCSSALHVNSVKL